MLRKWTDSELGENSGENGDIEKYFAMKVSGLEKIKMIFYFAIDDA